MNLIADPAPKPRFFIRAARVTAAAALFTCAVGAVSLLHLTPAAQAAEPSDLHSTAQIAAPAAPAPFTPDPGTLTSHDNGQTWSDSEHSSTPTTTTNQTYTASAREAGSQPRTQRPTQATLPEQATPGVAPVPPIPPVPATPAVPPVPTLPVSTIPMPPEDEQPQIPVIIHGPDMDAVQIRDLTRMRVDMTRLSAELKSRTDPQTRAQLRASLANMRAQLNSPEFKQQIKQATDAAAKVRLEMPAMQIQFQNLGQLNDPAFRAKFAAAEKAQALIAKLNLDDAPAQTQSPSPAAREALHQTFRKRVAEARRDYIEQLHAADGDQARIDVVTKQFVTEIQTLTTGYVNDIQAAKPNWTR